MQFEPPLIPGKLVRRYKRFLADVECVDGSVITVHCPNPGAMLGLNTPGAPVWLSDSGNPKRKLRHTLELMEADGVMVGINTQMPNRLAREAMDMGLVDGVSPEDEILPEQKYGENSRIDFLVRSNGMPDHYIEVKNVHLRRKPNLHEFPDSVTSRGTKHLHELMREVENGNQATMLFMVQRMDGERFAIAEDIDPAYAAAFKSAMEAGVKAQCIVCDVSFTGITPVRKISII